MLPKRPFGPIHRDDHYLNIPFIDGAEIEACSHCGYWQEANFTFCASCGERHVQIHKAEVESRKEFQKSVKALGLYGVFIVALIISITILDPDYKGQMFFDFINALISLAFFASIKGLWSILLPKKLNWNLLAFVAMIGLATPWLVSNFIDWISLNLELEELSLIYWNAPYPLVFSLVSVALFPAFFEELTFRGFVYHHLEKIGGPKTALWASAFLFAIIHFSFLSLIWLIPFGLILGYLRQKSGRLIYGIILHFMHNAGVVILEWNGY